MAASEKNPHNIIVDIYSDLLVGQVLLLKQIFLMSRLPCDAYHHYYHYQSSAQYLWLAETLVILNKICDAEIVYNKAIFQDHFNQAAIDGLNNLEKPKIIAVPVYDKHPIYDAEFCQSIGRKISLETEVHDKAVDLYLASKFDEAISLLEQNFEHSNSHFLMGKCYFAKQEYENAEKQFLYAIAISHKSHNEYHIFASNQHLARGKEFFVSGELDLAIADFSKSLDLYPKNQETIRARANAYQSKGNYQLAELDNANLL